MNRSSKATNREISLIKADGSTVGKAILADELFSRAMFLSGLKSPISPFFFLYAFMPSKHSKA